MELISRAGLYEDAVVVMRRSRLRKAEDDGTRRALEVVVQ